MLATKIIGIIIIASNMVGFGFLLFMGGLVIREKYFQEQQHLETPQPVENKIKSKIMNDDIIPDEDDVLKDIELSDLDSLDLDDFE